MLAGFWSLDLSAFRKLRAGYVSLRRIRPLAGIIRLRLRPAGLFRAGRRQVDRVRFCLDRQITRGALTNPRFDRLSANGIHKINRFRSC